MAIITKGPIGELDRSKWDGVSRTFTRDTSTGGVLTLRRVGTEVDVLSSYGGGVNLTHTTIASALTAIGDDNPVTIVLAPGTWTISANVDWSAYTNITFRVPAGALISHGSYTMNIPNLDAGAYNIFSGTGAITLSGAPTRTYPQWWGAVGDGVTDSATALQAWLTASNYHKAYGPNGTYLTSVALNYPPYINLEGESRTHFIIKASTGMASILKPSTNGFFGRLSNFKFDGNLQTFTGAVLDIQSAYGGALFENFWIADHDGAPGIRVGPGTAGDGIAGITIRNGWLTPATNSQGIEISDTYGAFSANIIGLTIDKLIVETTGTAAGMYITSASEGNVRNIMVRDYWYMDQVGTGYPIYLDGCCHSNFEHIFADTLAPYIVYISKHATGVNQSYGNSFKQMVRNGGSGITNAIFDGFNNRVSDLHVKNYEQGIYWSDFAYYNTENYFPNLTLAGRTHIYMASAPTDKSWAIGSVIWNSAPANGGSPGWVCTSSGTFSSATDSSGVTNGSTGLITGMTDTSDFNLGDWVTVSAGFASTGPYMIVSKTTYTITVTANSNSAETGVTVATPDPVFNAMAALD